ncbi:MAG: DUF4113 domain-containing protein [Sphingobacteriia bacterium]|nr:DUF4113 domain-containing protein [Sphingobacteriia bacterium]
MIASTRSFGKPIKVLDQLSEAISNYVARGAEKIRNQNSYAKAIYVFVRTNRFKEDYYQNSMIHTFTEPTDDTGFMIKTAKQLLEEIYIPNLEYKKAGVVFLDLIPKNNIQTTLLPSHIPNEKLMKVMDKLNSDFGKATIFFAAQGVKQEWQMKSSNRSPRYTTKWNEIIKVS